VVCGGVRGCHSQAQSVAGREPVQAGNPPVPVSAGLPGGGIMVLQPIPFHYTEQNLLARRPADPAGIVRCIGPDLWSCARGNIQETGKLIRMDEWRWRTGCYYYYYATTTTTTTTTTALFL
jgi:hypothetical protein